MALCQSLRTPTMVIFSCLLFLWVVSSGRSDASTLRLKDYMVPIKPVTNISVLLVLPTSALVVWDAPQVYPFITGGEKPPSTAAPTTANSHTSPSPTPDHKNASLAPPTAPNPSSNSSSPSPSKTSPPPVPTTTTTEIPGARRTTEETYNASYVDYVPGPPDHCLDLNSFQNVTLEAMRGGQETYQELVKRFRQKVESKSWNMTLHKGLHEGLVEFDKGCIRTYTLVYLPSNNASLEKSIKKWFPGGVRPEANLTGLEPGTKYNLTILTEYFSNDVLNSSVFQFTTPSKDLNITVECACDAFGSLQRNCNMSSVRMCQCRQGYSGQLCEECDHGFYRTTPYFPCHACPCQPYKAQTASCHFREGFLVCDRCRSGYTGNMCQQCEYGYYRLRQHCIPCNCHQNTARDAPQVCDPYSGECRFCARNTTGFNCERCLPGFVGDAVNFKNCTHKSEVGLPGGLSAPTIAGICIGVILALSAIAGAIVYRRWTSFAPFKPFWTVELQEDHEGVSFSPIENMEHAEAGGPDPLHKQSVEDGEYYKLQGGSGAYSPLYEEV